MINFYKNLPIRTKIMLPIAIIFITFWVVSLVTLKSAGTLRIRSFAKEDSEPWLLQ